MLNYKSCKFLICFLFTTIFLLFVTCPFISNAEDLEKSVVYIEYFKTNMNTGEKDKASTNGTGFVIRSDKGELLILTACHVAENCKNNDCIIKFFEDDRSFNASFMRNYFDKKLDIAILKLVGDPNHYVCPLPIFDDQQIRKEQKTFIIGHCNFDRSWQKATGRITNIQGSQIAFNCDICRDGYSGGPLFDSDSKKLIGMFINTDQQLQKECFAIKFKHIAINLIDWKITPFSSPRIEGLLVDKNLDDWFKSINQQNLPTPSDERLAYLRLAENT